MCIRDRNKSFRLGRSGEPSDEDVSRIHQSIGGLAIQKDLVIAADIEGFVHCYDAKTGKAYWHHDTLSLSYGSPLIIRNRIYLGVEDGEIRILALSKKKTRIAQRYFRSSIETPPVFANGTLFVASRNRLHAIQEDDD